MKISELTAGQGKVLLVGDVTEKGDPKAFEKFGKTKMLSECKLQDDSGEIKLTLWDAEIDMVKLGDKVQLTNGYVAEYQNILSVSTGKFGKLKVVGGTEPIPVEQIESAPPTPAKAAVASMRNIVNPQTLGMCCNLVSRFMSQEAAYEIKNFGNWKETFKSSVKGMYKAVEEIEKDLAVR